MVALAYLGGAAIDRRQKVKGAWMLIDDGEPKLTSGRRSYDRLMRRRLRIANFAAWLRAGGIQLVWLVILVAGAGVPLSAALIEQGWSWVSPTLGFVIVIAAGLERIFGRTTEAAVTLDRLRRDLARERRMLIANIEPYAEAGDPFALYSQRSEEHISRYDQQMSEYHSQILRHAP